MTAAPTAATSPHSQVVSRVRAWERSLPTQFLQLELRLLHKRRIGAQACRLDQGSALALLVAPLLVNRRRGSVGVRRVGSLLSAPRHGQKGRDRVVGFAARFEGTGQ